MHQQSKRVEDLVLPELFKSKKSVEMRGDKERGRWLKSPQCLECHVGLKVRKDDQRTT